MKNKNCILESKYSQEELKHISILPTMLCAKSQDGSRRDACNVSKKVKFSINLEVFIKECL
jgi:hypothetical protein